MERISEFDLDNPSDSKANLVQEIFFNKKLDEDYSEYKRRDPSKKMREVYEEL